MKGKVKFFNKKKGYGFIVGNDDNKEYFVHISALKESSGLEENEDVKFDAVETDKGMQAQNVISINSDGGDSQSAPDESKQEAQEASEDEIDESKDSEDF